ncbi:MAG: glycine oxidase ThiO [Acidobacteria bacterium]|nr:MAG: glycine oxidase ThiO [Acidobacteriota bacterium]
MHDVIVIGGGVIGLSIARELAGRKSVLLLDRGSTGQGTSRAAAGMLTPLSEADDQGPFFQLCRASHAMYDGFVQDLQSETGSDVGYSTDGLLCLSSSEDSANVIQRRYEWQKNAGFDVQLLSADAVHEMEPLVTVPICTAVFIPGDRSVTPRRLVNALREACFNRGVEIRTGLHVDSIARNQVRVGKMILEAANIVIASGVWSPELSGLDPPIPVYPRKGQILSLGMPAGAFRRMIRWGSSYFVPRSSGELVVGATNEDVGFDLSNTPAGLGRLLMDAQQISSHVGAYPILETWTGLRPATPDELPILGPSAIPGVYYATGHYRNGVLLAPITAAIVSDLVRGRKPGFAIDAYAPSRFGMGHV